MITTMEQDHDNWLKGLKVGDQFKVNRPYGGGYDVHRISRESKTRFYFYYNEATNYEGSFRKSDGLVIGGNDGGRFSYNIYVKRITEEDVAVAEKKKITRWLREQTFNKYTLSQLRSIRDLMLNYKEENENDNT